MNVIEQVRANLAKLIERDGCVNVRQFTNWCAKELLSKAPPVSAWPERRKVEKALVAAFNEFVFRAVDGITDEGEVDTVDFDSAYFKGKDGNFHEYIVKNKDETSQKRAKEHFAALEA